MTSPAAGRSIALSALVWGALISAGILQLYAYETGAGHRTGSPARWPEASALDRSPGRFTIVLFAHPDCPCTRASLSELEAIVSAVGLDPTVHVVYSAGERGASWDAAGRIPRVHRHLDPGQVETRRFGALTSGYVVVYAPSGALRFSGGITGSRGHAGINAGREQVLQILRGERAEADHAVFGCALVEDDRR